MLTAVVLFVALSGTAASTPQIAIESVGFQYGHVLSLQVTVESPEPINVYSWRGHLYPAVGYFLAIEVRDDQGQEIAALPVLSVMPKVPHRHDVVRSRTYRYPEPMELVFSKAISGCAEVRLVYDTTADPSGRLRAVGLDAVRLISNTITVCNKAAQNENDR